MLAVCVGRCGVGRVVAIVLAVVLAWWGSGCWLSCCWRCSTSIFCRIVSICAKSSFCISAAAAVASVVGRAVVASVRFGDSGGVAITCLSNAVVGLDVSAVCSSVLPASLAGRGVGLSGLAGVFGASPLLDIQFVSLC